MNNENMYSISSSAVFFRCMKPQMAETLLLTYSNKQKQDTNS